MENNKRKNYFDWDETFMQICHVIAQRSKDPNTQTGACIVSSDNVILGVGYNGFPRGCSDDNLPWDRDGDFCDNKYAYVVHSEENAILNANSANLKEAKMYCSLFPCNECAKAIIQSGIKEVIYASDKYHDTDIWKSSRRMFDLAGVKYREYVPKYKIEFKK